MTKTDDHVLQLALDKYRYFAGSTLDQDSERRPETGSADRNGSEQWDGDRVDHVYRDSFGFSLSECPKCSKPIKPKRLGIIYSAYEEVRTQTGPWASVCDYCSVAVICEALVDEFAFLGGYDYALPLAMFNIKNGPPLPENLEFFKTYEGNEPVFMIGDDGEIEDVIYRAAYQKLTLQEQQRRSDIQKRAKQRRKQQKMSRKKNRRR
ncbi:MAG: hypothetical protein M3Q07_05225 [Pseudobdellovibrionaceae bacterium]|nr:hypothetical protein [Pseudobdellovibrionaceae bacterium]